MVSIPLTATLRFETSWLRDFISESLLDLESIKSATMATKIETITPRAVIVSCDIACSLLNCSLLYTIYGFKRLSFQIVILFHVSVRTAPDDRYQRLASNFYEYMFRYMRRPRRAAIGSWPRGAGGPRGYPLASVVGRVREGERSLSSLGQRVRLGRLAVPDGLQAGRSRSVCCAAGQPGHACARGARRFYG